MFLGDLLMKLLTALGRGFWRAVNVKLSAPSDKHTATEYADALLFADTNEGASDSTPPSILDSHHH
jgi:hypothetical protein